MKCFVLIGVIAIAFSINAQSKKEQIENLNYQIDSLNQVLLKEQKLNINSTFEISQLNGELTRLNASISSLNAEVSKLTSSLKSNQEELSKLQAQLKVKSDSLLLVQKELNKLKPPPIQINNTPAVVSQQIGPYKTVQIGTQVWMTKNLDVATFRNGEEIPQAKNDDEWEKASNNKEPAWCYLDFDPLNGEKFGKLYNWYAVNDHRGLAPNGYHIPKEDEWEILLNFIGRDNTTKLCSSPEYRTEVSFVDEGGYYETKWVACTNCRVASQEYKKICPTCKGNGGKYVKTGKFIPKTKRKVEKKIQIGGWEGSNESGFSALPAGGKDWDDGFYKKECKFWTSTELPDDYDYWGRPYKYAKELSLSNGRYYFHKMNQEYGCSVRCIKD
ncbi:MAG: hypothetical protein FJX80_06540 [Bacteroidetes bacterium]|nr:hypothetical protein [Bacteroidota bacterium]